MAFDPGTRENFAFAAWCTERGFLGANQGSVTTVFKEVHGLFRGLDARFIMEEVFVGANPRSALKLAKYSGQMYGFCRLASLVTDGWWWEPRAQEWRSAIGFAMRQPNPVPGKPGRTRATNAKEFQRYACARAQDLTGDYYAPKNEHKADAVCIGFAALQRWKEQQRGSRQPSLLTT